MGKRKKKKAPFIFIHSFALCTHTQRIGTLYKALVHTTSRSSHVDHHHEHQDTSTNSSTSREREREREKKKKDVVYVVH